MFCEQCHHDFSWQEAEKVRAPQTMVSRTAQNPLPSTASDHARLDIGSAVNGAHETWAQHLARVTTNNVLGEPEPANELLEAHREVDDRVREQDLEDIFMRLDLEADFDSVEMERVEEICEIDLLI